MKNCYRVIFGVLLVTLTVAFSSPKTSFYNLNVHSMELDTVRIGKQTWMASNLQVTHFRNGDTIYEAQSEKAWKRAFKDKVPAWCYYNGDTAFKEYGKMYNSWAVEDERNLAPEGWHIPVDEEFKVLVGSLRSAEPASAQLKSVEGWKEFSKKKHVPGTNSSGFNGYPLGFRISTGMSGMKGFCGYWWCTNNFQFQMFSQFEETYIVGGAGNGWMGVPVRLLMDDNE